MSIGFLPGAVSRAAATLFIVGIFAGIALLGMTGFYAVECGWLAALTYLGPIVAAMLVKRKIVSRRGRKEHAAWRVLTKAFHDHESIWQEFFPWGMRCRSENLEAIRQTYPEWAERLAKAEKHIEEAQQKHRPVDARYWAADGVPVFLPVTAIVTVIHLIVFLVS